MPYESSEIQIGETLLTQTRVQVGIGVAVDFHPLGMEPDRFWTTTKVTPKRTYTEEPSGHFLDKTYIEKKQIKHVGMSRESQRQILDDVESLRADLREVQRELRDAFAPIEAKAARLVHAHNDKVREIMDGRPYAYDEYGTSEGPQSRFRGGITMKHLALLREIKEREDGKSGNGPAMVVDHMHRRSLDPYVKDLILAKLVWVKDQEHLAGGKRLLVLTEEGEQAVADGLSERVGAIEFTMGPSERDKWDGLGEQLTGN